MNITFDDREVKMFLGKIQNSEPIRKSVMRDISAKGARLASQLAPKGATSHLSNSFVAKSSADKATIANRQLYSDQAMEYGRKPGKYPMKNGRVVESLRRWTRVKLGDERLAYVVARAIAKRGTRKYRDKGPKQWTRTAKAMNRFMPSILKKLAKFYT